MANSRNFYFSEILDHEDLQYAFDALEAADKAQMADLTLYGLISGGAISNVTTTGTSSVDVAAFLGIDKNGARVTMAAPLTVALANDEAGNPTLPTSGHVKWLTIAVHYAKFGSDHVLDGDGLDIYSTTVESISSEMGALDVDHSPSLVGTLRLIQGTEATTIGAAGRPAVSSPDIIICDLAIDHTGYVIGGMAGVSTARTDRIALKTSGAPINTGGHEPNDYILQKQSQADNSGLTIREYVGVSGGGNFTAAVQTINARWDGVAQLWNADQSSFPAKLFQMTTHDVQICQRTTGAATWTDARHDTGGWDARFTISTAVANGDVSIDGNGVVIGNGPQTAYIMTQFYAMAGYPLSGGGQAFSASATWPQQLTASPSSQTIIDDDGFGLNVSGISASAGPYGVFITGNVVAAAALTRMSRRVVSVP